MSTRRALLGMVPAAIAAHAFPSAVPDFQGVTLEGHRFSRDSLKGRPVLIQFWATWCRFCRRDQPAVDALAQEFAGRLTLLAVNVNEPEKTVRKYLASSPRKGFVVLSSTTNLPALFEAEAFPHYVLLDAGSGLKGNVKGAIGGEGLRHLLARVGL